MKKQSELTLNTRSLRRLTDFLPTLPTGRKADRQARDYGLDGCYRKLKL